MAAPTALQAGGKGQELALGGSRSPRPAQPWAERGGREIPVPEPGGHLRDIPLLVVTPCWARSNPTRDKELCVQAIAGAVLAVSPGTYADYNNHGRKVKHDLLPADEDERNYITKC